MLWLNEIPAEKWFFCQRSGIQQSNGVEDGTGLAKEAWGVAARLTGARFSAFTVAGTLLAGATGIALSSCFSVACWGVGSSRWRTAEAFIRGMVESQAATSSPWTWTFRARPTQLVEQLPMQQEPGGPCVEASGCDSEGVGNLVPPWIRWLHNKHLILFRPVTQAQTARRRKHSVKVRMRWQLLITL